jgi:hypothetical protein
MTTTAAAMTTTATVGVRDGRRTQEGHTEYYRAKS